jgi:malate dehydrogenase (oxaloacetate-decarboxylating)(NADP+)
MDSNLSKSAIEYHRGPKPGKLAIVATKALGNQRDLSLAYSPGVAAVCEEIVQNEAQAFHLTARGNLVAVITNGTAVLGLGNIGPLAAKPVMEGKAVLFKKFGGIDVFDIELNEHDTDKLVDIIASLEPTFGAINLEDIKAPQCFEIERRLAARLKIPVFHDDQHGTAICVAATILNGLELVKKDIKDVKLVCSGAGAAALACLRLLEKLGLPRKNVFVCDTEGVIYKGRKIRMDPFKEVYQQDTKARVLDDVMDKADIFLGLSVGKILNPESLAKMAQNPLVLALANPIPEIDPNLAKTTRPDVIVATGRSDYYNQVNNVLCFPFIFRGALDVGATCINDDMQIACVHAIANLAKAELSDIVAIAYESEEFCFGPDYIIPKPFDPRLIVEIAPAVAKAAMDSGVATRPITDLETYKQSLSQYVYRSSLAMKPIFAKAKHAPKRIVYSDGEEERILRTAQIVIDEGIAYPMLIGRKRVVELRINRLGLRMKNGVDFELIDPEDDPRFQKYWLTYHNIMARQGVSPEFAKMTIRTDTTVIAAMMVYLKEADCMLCGPVGRFRRHLQVIKDVLGIKPNVSSPASLNIMIQDIGIFCIGDGYVNQNPCAKELAEITLLAAEQVRQFGIQPKVAMISASNFGTFESPSGCKMREALNIVRTLAPELEIDGEMNAEAAIDPVIRKQRFPNSSLQGPANTLIMPDIDSANIALGLIKCLGDAQSVGPILLGINGSAHILASSVTVRGIFNMTAVAVVDAQRHSQEMINPLNFPMKYAT